MSGRRRTTARIARGTTNQAPVTTALPNLYDVYIAIPLRLERAFVRDASEKPRRREPESATNTDTPVPGAGVA